jgi:outer membrane biosynthesis protein TonB
MIYGIEENEMKKPEVLGPRSVGMAVALHIVAFLLLYLFAMLHLKPRETVIPIDLTVVVNENLDGEENEPPPLDNPPPKVEQPKPTPPPAPPKVEEKIEAVEQIVEKKPEKPKEKPPEKPKEEKKPDPPKPEKTKEQLMKERLERMRNSAKEVKNPPKIVVKNQPSGNGKTDKQNMSEAETRKLLNQGYKPGTSTQLAASEEQRCISLIREAFYAKWNRPPWTDSLREMLLDVQFDINGRVRGYRLSKSSGDAKADATVTQAAALVSVVHGLSTDFLRKNQQVTIRFKVTPQ